MKFDYRTKYFFPMHVVTLGHALIFMGAVFLAMVHWIPGAVFISTGLFIVSINHGLSIDTSRKVYHDYVFVLGYKTGKKLPYEEIQYLFVTGGKKTTTMQLRGVSQNIVQQEFNGYIKFSEDEKIHIVSSRKKQKIMTFLERMAVDLSLEIKDLAQ